MGGISGTMVARWTADQQVEQAILHQGHDSQQIHLISPGCPRPSITLQCRIMASITTAHLPRPEMHCIFNNNISTPQGPVIGYVLYSSVPFFQEFTVITMTM